MASVSLEISSPIANVNAKVKGARADKAPGNDGFGALVDSNIADAAPADTPAPQDRPQQQVTRSDEPTPASTDRREPRETKQAATKSTNDTPNATAADATQIETDIVADTPDVKVSAETEAKVTSGVAATEIALAAEITADTATTDTAATTEEAAVPASLLTVIAQTGIVPAAITVAANTAVTDVPVETDAIGVTGVTVATPAGAANAEVTVAAPATPVTAQAADGAEAAVDADAAVTVQTATADTTADATPATGEPAATDDALLAAAAQAATATKPAKAAVTGEATVEVKSEAAAQVTAKPDATVNLTQPARKTDAEPVSAPKLETAKTDTGLKPAAKAEAGEAAATATQTQEQRPQRTAARVEGAVDAQVQSDVQQNTAQHAHTLTAQVQSQTPGAANAAAPLNASVQLANNVAVPLSGLAVNIALNAQAGQSRFEIRLDPAELGRIDVRLEVDRNGQVTSHLTVERPATLDMLRRDAPQLQRALEDAGLKTGDSGLQFSLRDQSQQQQRADEDSKPNSYRLVVDEIPAIPAETARTYARLAAARGGVDIRI